MKQNLKQKMQTDLEQVTKRLAREEEKFDEQELKVKELRRQAEALQSALNIMEGDSTGVPTVLYKPVKTQEQELVAEPGFKYVKSSMGEAILVPENFDPVVLETPAPQNIVPPLESDSFVPDGPGGD